MGRKVVVARKKSLPVDKQKATVVAAVKKGPPVDQRKAAIVADKKVLPFDWETLLAGISRGKTILEYGANRNIFMQGQPADSLFFLLRGKVKLSVTSSDGKEAIVATLDSGEFFGEGCLAGQPLRMATAISVEDCTLARVEKPMMARMLHEEQGLAEMFVTHLLSRNIRYEADLVDQLFNPSEKRLARILLLLSHFGKESKTETVVPGINQENLAQMVGTTRSRVSHFMNKFRKLGFIDYKNGGELTVNSGLLSIALHD
ncbi:MAG: Crp/Fnr family transcriptional regulator, partial [bacterium]|nr:Crp/Fnr family transcriptional regulator [bacterium]